MAPTRLDEAAGLTVAEVIHPRFSTLPGTATVGEVQAWFASKESHKMALLADDGRYVGSLLPDDLEDADPAQAAAELVRPGPTVAPGDPAKRGEELALSPAARRVPVVDAVGRLLVIVAVTNDLQGFFGPLYD